MLMNNYKQTQSDNNNWKGGKQEYSCLECGQRGGDKHAHHILSFSGYPEERFAVDNGITVCLPCHGELHGWSEGDSRSGARL